MDTDYAKKNEDITADKKLLILLNEFSSTVAMALAQLVNSPETKMI